MPEKRRDEMDENPMEPEITDRADVKAIEPEDILLTEDGQKFLNQTRPWVRFFSIMLFISVAFALIGALTVMIVTITGSMFNTGNEAFDTLPGGGFAIGLLYLVMAVLYIPPGLFLSRYASAIRYLESTPTSQALERALKFQKSFWRYMGILTVAGLIIGAAAIAFSLAVGLFMFLNR
jgi:hypothetical protein